MARREYSDETKAAVMAALLDGQSVNAVAKEYKIPKGTVSGWKHQAQGVVNVSTQKKESIGDRLVESVEAKLTAIIAIYGVVKDPAWVKLQNAADLAVFVGVTEDKLMRQLEAFGDSEDGDANVPET
jgi:hypothetical protein